MTKSFASAALAALLGVLAAGCSSGETATKSDSFAKTSSRIISGTDSTSDQDAVILLAVRDSTGLKGTCTGTLVAPNLVLTARHCVSDTDEGALCTKDGTPLKEGVVRDDRPPSSLYVYAGVDAIRSADDPARAAARGKSVFHETVSNICDADVAFILLDQSIQGRVAPMRLTSTAREGEKLTAIGWGLTNGGTLPTTRQQRSNIPVEAVGPVVLDAQSNIGLGPSEFLVGEAFCSGDSGGPTFSTKGAVVGVVSRGGGGGMSMTNDAANCIGNDVVNFYTQLSQKSQLIEKAFAAAGATPRSEGDPPGLGVGEACKTNLECSSDACVKGTCERRCDDGTTCAASESCTPFEDKKVCTPAPDAPKTPTSGDPAPAGAAPQTTTTTTTTSGCSASPRTTSSSSFALVGLAIGLVLARRRLRTRD
jgi:hypothetical protein